MVKRIIANWKMQLAVPAAERLATALVRGPRTKAEVVLCPSFVALPAVSAVVHRSWVTLGAQTCGPADRGAFTGEVSPGDLRSLACQYVIVGHSDRRAFGETNVEIAARLKAALAAGLTPVLCVGERLAERQVGRSQAVVAEQIDGAFRALPAAKRRRVLIAYEPVWAISPGGPIQPDEAKAMARFIWTHLKQRRPLTYGGSVTPANVATYVDGVHFDGALVGQASLTLRALRALADA